MSKKEPDKKPPAPKKAAPAKPKISIKISIPKKVAKKKKVVKKTGSVKRGARKVSSPAAASNIPPKNPVKLKKTPAATPPKPARKQPDAPLVDTPHDEQEFLREQKKLEEEAKKIIEPSVVTAEPVEDELPIIPVKGKKKKRRWLLWLLLLLAGLTSFIGFRLIFTPYIQSKKTHHSVSSVDMIIRQMHVLVNVSSASNTAAPLVSGQTQENTPAQDNHAVHTTQTEALSDNFSIRPLAHYQLAISDILLSFNLQRLEPRPVVPPAPTAEPTENPTAVPAKTTPVPLKEAKIKPPAIKIIRIKAKPKSVPLGGRTVLKAVVNSKDREKIDRVVWKSKFGTVVTSTALEATWQAPNRKGSFIVKCIIYAKDGSYTVKRIRLHTSQNVYIADVQNNCIQKFNGQGKFIFKFGQEGKKTGQFDNPNAVAVDRQRNLWVADTGNHRIQKFTPDGKFLMQIGKEGKEAGDFQEPYSIAVDLHGNIYVAEFIGNRIQKFDSQGNYLLQFGGTGSAPGEFNNPSGLYIDDNTSYLYVSDMKNHRVQKFNFKGDFISQFGSFGSAKGQFNSPVGIAIDSKSNIYVVDQVNHRIQKFSKNGKYLLWFGGEGHSPGRLYYPMGIVINHADEIFITDQCNHRVSIYDPEGNYYGSFGSRGHGDGEFFFPIGISLDF